MFNCYKLTILLLVIVPSVNAQKKSSIKEKNIRAITEYKQDIEKKGPKLKETYTLYDSNGNVLEEIEYDSGGKVKLHMKYQYDADDNKIKETELDPQGKIIRVTEFKYNSDLKTEKNIYDSSGKLKTKRTYQYEYQK